MSCCVRAFPMTAGWISKVPAVLLPRDDKSPNAICRKSKHLSKKRPLSMNLLWENWHNLPEDAVRRWQSERLQKFLRDAVLPFSAHYKKVFNKENLTADSFRSLEDLAKIPFTTKADL